MLELQLTEQRPPLSRCNGPLLRQGGGGEQETANNTNIYLTKNSNPDRLAVARGAWESGSSLIISVFYFHCSKVLS